VLTGIVQHHYEQRRRQILASLDAEIAIEKKGLREAREEAIGRLEAFVRRYAGANAHPENTPDAMFRLAALYEERARADSDGGDDLGAKLRPAIALYKRVLREYPSYRELAAVHYYLGHAYNDSNRVAEAQQVWRSLVCRNKYAYPVAAEPNDPERDQVTPLPQDHDRAYWSAWEGRHVAPGGKAANARRAPRSDEEETFRTPYPDDCVAIRQPTVPGAEPRYLAEVWWLIGDYHFNGVDGRGGPFAYARAEAAYRHSLHYRKPPVHGVAMYKLAWTYFKQQRYEASVHAFVELLRYTDEQEAATGDPGTDFRSEAVAYIASSLTYVDFSGPGPDEPYVPRSDALDEQGTSEAKLRVAIDRVQDPRIIPQGEKWTPSIYIALAQEFKELHQYRNTIDVDERILERWPLYRGAPTVQGEIADLYDVMAARAREGTHERDASAAKALEARTRLDRYVGTTPWVEANKDDPEAIQGAERLVHGGLRRAAADHTNAASALAQRALSIADKETRDPIFERALTEYRLAAQGWAGVLTRERDADDTYDSRYWLADANHGIVVTLVALDRTPTSAEVETARKTATDVRDSNEGDKYLQPSAFMLVDVAQQVLTDRYEQFERTKGASGFALRRSAPVSGHGASPLPMPAEVLAAIAARDDYRRRVPESLDTPRNAGLYAFDAADFYFLYGHFDEARRRFRQLWQSECNKSGLAYRAWERLVTMSNVSNDTKQSRELVAADSCPFDDAQTGRSADLKDRTKGAADYQEAAEAYQVAEAMKDGGARTKQWSRAAALYRSALEKEPHRDVAPAAALSGAVAHERAREPEKAAEMYQLFLRSYADEKTLDALEKADAKAYAERVKDAKRADDALAASYLARFDFASAAAIEDEIGKNRRFDAKERRAAVKNAVLLHANGGDRDKLLAARGTFLSLDPPVDERAEVDFVVASAELKAWDEKGSDAGENGAARARATAAMERYFDAFKDHPETGKYLVQAAYAAAKTRRAGRDRQATAWCAKAVRAFDSARSTGKELVGPAEAELAAECAYRAIDEELAAGWDYDTGHHRYQGVVDRVKRQFEDDNRKASDTWFKRLEDVITRYQSRTWSVAARARQASLYDATRTGLFQAQPPALKLYTPHEEQVLAAADASDNDTAKQAADDLRQRRRELWRVVRGRSLAEADAAMVKFYVEAVLWARAWKARNASVELAVQRLAFFTDLLGDARIREMSAGVIDPETRRPFVYRDGMFLLSRPGASTPIESDGRAAPLPVQP
jgi:hypothetical protein